MHPVQLTGPQLVLREWEPGDLDAMVDWASDPVVMRWISSGQTFSRDEEKEFLAGLLAQATSSERVQYNLAVVAETDLVVGGVRVGVSSAGHRRGDIGYVIRRDRWGRGYATEAARLVVEFGFEHLDLHRIFAYCHVDNRASARVLEKTGMRFEGHLRDHMWTIHGWRDSLMYAVLESDDRPAAWPGHRTGPS